MESQYCVKCNSKRSSYIPDDQQTNNSSDLPYSLDFNQKDNFCYSAIYCLHCSSKNFCNNIDGCNKECD